MYTDTRKYKIGYANHVTHPFIYYTQWCTTQIIFY